VWHDARSRGEIRCGSTGADRQHGWHDRDNVGLMRLNLGQRPGNECWPRWASTRPCTTLRGGMAGWAASEFRPIRLGKIENHFPFSNLFYKFQTNLN
jgi:hypothetical protein